MSDEAEVGNEVARLSRLMKVIYDSYYYSR